MTFVLKEIIHLSPEAVHHLDIPYVFGPGDTERLKHIIYTALTYLRNRTEVEILTAPKDVFILYNWFFDTQKAQLHQKVKKQLEKDLQIDQMRLSSYTDVDSYIEDTIETLKLAYLSKADVLNAILLRYPVNSLKEIQHLSTNFSDTELFCALALYYAAIAIEELTDIRKLLDNHPNALAKDILKNIKRINHAILEAQIALDYAQIYNKSTTPMLSNVIQAWTSEHHKWLMQKAHQTRYGDKHLKRHEKAWELYQKYRPHHISDNNAIAAFVDEIQAYSDELGLEKLKYGSEIDTIYRWILRRKNKPQDK